ncbi:protease inhibitor I42 family protein [Chloroflexota bacterium]
MKTKLSLAIIVASVFITLAACSPGSAKVDVEVSHDDFVKVQDTISRNVSKNIEVSAGSLFTVALWSNPTTGFQWSESAAISDQDSVRQTGHEFVPPAGMGDSPPPPGASGKEVWTFKALKKGTTTISMEYSQPWEGGEKDAFGFFLTVVVK